MRLWKSSEHFYQAHKFEGEHFENVYNLESPYETKKYAKNNAKYIIPIWDDIKDDVMAEAVLNKFTQNYDLKLLLINTTPHYLVEGNTWCDNYWGNCSCGYCTNIEGQNKLGITLMAVRNILTK